MEKKRTNIYITEEVANVLKEHHEEETGQKGNLSGAITYIANKLKKRKKR